MRTGAYRVGERRTKGVNRRRYIALFVLVLLIGGLGYWLLFSQSPVEQSINRLQFEDSITEAEKQSITLAVEEKSVTYDGSVTVGVDTAFEQSSPNSTLEAYVPVSGIYATLQTVSKADLATLPVGIMKDTDEKVRQALASAIGVEPDSLQTIDKELKDLSDQEIVLLPASQLSSDVKLLSLENNYYLDTLSSGAIFRQAVYKGSDTTALADLKVNQLPTKDSLLKVNQTGVTALTRIMQKKLATVGDATYFSEKIKPTLSDADIVHVSNEVSFREGCTYSNVSFCSPPEFIKTLQDSGVNLVELTGNHNNDNGHEYNTETINLYHSLGIQTFGGGLNAAEAAKPYISDKKGTKVAFLGYNMADGPNSGAVAGESRAGAKANQKTDKILEGASSSNRYDEVFMETMSGMLADYKKDLESIFKSVESEEIKKILNNAYVSADTLIKKPGDQAASAAPN